MGQEGVCSCFTFTELGTVIHTLVIVLVLRAEGCVVVVPEGVPPCVASVVPHKKAIAVDFIAQGELLILCIAYVAFPVLPQNSEEEIGPIRVVMKNLTVCCYMQCMLHIFFQSWIFHEYFFCCRNFPFKAKKLSRAKHYISKSCLHWY